MIMKKITGHINWKKEAGKLIENATTANSRLAQ